MTGFDLSPVQATALACLISHCNEVPCVDDVECDLGFFQLSCSKHTYYFRAQRIYSAGQFQHVGLLVGL